MGSHREPISASRRVSQLQPLTSLRFFAALYVVLFHYTAFFDENGPRAGFIDLGFSGVTFFFVLSGFILAYNYSATDFSDAANVRRYCVARFARIYPLYAFSLIVSLPFFIKWLLRHGAGHVNYLETVSLVLAPLGLQSWVPGTACALNCPSWSISTELFFYFAFPLLLPLVLRQPRRAALLTAGVWVIISACYCLLWSHYGHGSQIHDPLVQNDPTTNIVSQFIMYFPVGRLPEFLLGILLFDFWHKHLRGQPDAPIAWLLVSFLIIGSAVVLFADRIPGALLHNGLTAAAWSPLILWGACLSTGFLTWQPTIFLGRISYALYLLHIPVVGAVHSIDKFLLGNELSHWPTTSIVGTLLLSLVTAAAAFRVIEEPGRRYIQTRWPIVTGSAPSTVQSF
jgi:peptidoglycan/LPS O-acetylase OafA/YrhL